MNSLELSFLWSQHSKNVVKAAKIDLYGLHYESDWIALLARNLVLKALQHNLDCPVEVGETEAHNVYYYDNEQIKCMLATTNRIGQSKSRVRSGNNNCC
jgi:hypothetical protein